MKTFAFVAACGAIGVGGLLACSSTPTGGALPGPAEKDAGRDVAVGDSAPSPESGLGELLFRPDQLYSGTDGTHTFKVPIAVYDSDPDLAVTSSDPAALTLTKVSLKNPVDQDGITDNGKYFMVAAKKAGTFTLTASSRGRTTTATITITSYDAARYEAGRQRYETAGTGADRPCKTCHVNGDAIDHSPAALATATDQEIGIIITTGVKPGPSVITIKSEPGTAHKWNVTDPQREGLVTYLRALDPRGFL